MMNGPADGPGPVELALVERLGVGGHALGQQHRVAREHAPPVRVGLGEGDDRLAVVDAAGRPSRRGRRRWWLAIAKALSLPLVAWIWDAMSSHVIGVPSLQTALGLMV